MSMKKLFFTFFGFLLSVAYVSAEWSITTQGIGKSTYTLNVTKMFPSYRKIPSDKGIDNISDYVIGMIPTMTTLIALWATIMVILGGFYMVTGGANSEQTEKWKSILKDAIFGMIIGLLAYVIIVTLWNILDI